MHHLNIIVVVTLLKSKMSNLEGAKCYTFTLLLAKCHTFTFVSWFLAQKFEVLIFFQTCTIYSSRGGISTQRDPAQPWPPLCRLCRGPGSQQRRFKTHHRSFYVHQPIQIVFWINTYAYRIIFAVSRGNRRSRRKTGHFIQYGALWVHLVDPTVWRVTPHSGHFRTGSPNGFHPWQGFWRWRTQKKTGNFTSLYQITLQKSSGSRYQMYLHQT